MARLNVSKIERDTRRGTGSPQREAVARYFTFVEDGKKYFQINMYGSKERENPGSVSQNIQLNKDDAIQLIALLQKEFSL